VRLAALKDAPYAFGSTWEHEKDRTELDWRKAVVSRTRYVAEADGQAVGMAAVGPSTYTGAADVTSVWVAPAARGKGVGDSLVMALIGWARERGFTQLLLWVADGNTYAEMLYERHGFSRTGDTKPVRPGEDRLEFQMSARFP
jgi:GNAT superfamily N-acetyltransferase